MRRLLVHFQRTLLDETLAAGLAAEGTLTGVNPLVAFQCVGLVEAFAASLAPERLLPRVYAQVALQVTLYCEAFVAVLTVVGPLSSVDHLVHFQAVGSIEALAALFAAKRPDLSVETLVVPQQLLQGETLPTNITGVWSLTCVREQHSKVNMALRAPLINIFNEHQSKITFHWQNCPIQQLNGAFLPL